MIIDCHGHYTTAPAEHTRWRADQLEAYQAGRAAPAYPTISDDAIRESIELNQLRLLRERGADLTVFSPRASAMGHHLGDLETSVAWAEVNNDLIARVVDLFGSHFAAVAQLPQTAGAPLAAAVAELHRCADMGFVGVNLNPDPSGGHWTSPPLTDPYWFGLFEALCERDLPAMIHVSASCNDAFHSTGAHYLNADTSVFMQLLSGDLFARFPQLRLVIPHGGGAVPFHWGRYRGLADMLGKPSLDDHLMGNVFFDTCVYHQPGIDLLVEVIETKNILFGSEMVGAVRGIDPTTGHYFDDTARYIEAADLDDESRQAILAGNVRRVYPRLDELLAAQGR
ncbi:MAG: amidohydrolase family protein [Nocardioides sp.]|uniref:amidohydrolase family protein n=1 Tax=Nocardioides sp. TaxID=35761 RepID=UPI0039E36BFD